MTPELHLTLAVVDDVLLRRKVGVRDGNELYLHIRQLRSPDKVLAVRGKVVCVFTFI